MAGKSSHDSVTYHANRDAPGEVLADGHLDSYIHRRRHIVFESVVKDIEAQRREIAGQ